MKHYLSYEGDGTISGINPYAEAGTGLHGWPNDYEIDNPDTEHEPSRRWRDQTKRPPTGGWYRYDCPCPRTSQSCNCPSVIRMTKYVEAGALRDKLTATVLVDGVTVERSGQVISKPVGSKCKVEIAVSGAPDGATISVMQGNQPQLLEDPEQVVELTLTNGSVPALDIWAPAQGFIGQLRIAGRICTLMEVRIRGWGS